MEQLKRSGLIKAREWTLGVVLIVLAFLRLHLHPSSTDKQFAVGQLRRCPKTWAILGGDPHEVLGGWYWSRPTFGEAHILRGVVPLRTLEKQICFYTYELTKDGKNNQRILTSGTLRIGGETLDIAACLAPIDADEKGAQDVVAAHRDIYNLCRSEILQSCPEMQGHGPSDLVPCLATHKEGNSPSCANTLNKLIAPATISQQDFEKFSSLFPQMTVEEFNDKDLDKIGELGFHLPVSAAKILATRSTIDDIPVKSYLSNNKGLFRMSINGMEAFAVESGFDEYSMVNVTLFFYDPQVPRLVASHDLGWPDQEKCLPHYRKTKIVDLDGDGKMDLLYIDYIEGFDEEWVCDIEGIHGKVWRGDRFEDSPITNEQQMKDRYFIDICKKTPASTQDQTR